MGGHKHPISEAEVLRTLQEAKTSIQAHKDQLPNALYKAMNGLSQTFLSYKEKNGAAGWAKEAVDEFGEPLWTAEQAAELEAAFPTAVAQAGGAMGVESLKFGPSSSLVTPSEPIDFSIDEIIGNVTSYLAALDKKNRELAALIGPVAIINNMKEDPRIGPLPFIGREVQIPARAILPMINAALEACRLLVSNQFIDSSFLRSIFSFALAILDISRGEWRDGILSALGLFGKHWMMVGLIGKTTRWVYNFISPDIQSRLSSDIFDASKSMIVGFWLWWVSILSPDFVRATINEMIASATKPLEEINEQLAKVEQQAQASAAKIGAKVVLPRLPIERIPSFDDIQNFQSLLHQPEIVCSAAFQQAIQPALAIPVLRVVLELFSVPFTPEKKAEVCKDIPADQPIAESLTEALKPTVVLPTPLKQGGAVIRRQRRSRRKPLFT
jgi:hypothetical protein